MSACINSFIKSGTTGMMIPQPVISIKRVINIKPIAGNVGIMKLYDVAGTNKTKI